MEKTSKNKKLLILPSVFLLAILFFSGCVSISSKQDENRSYSCKDCNVILIAFDGLQAKHLKYYGYSINTAPNLEMFMDTSYVFENAVSPSSWTVPTFMSIFTSMYPSEHGLVNKFSGYDEEKKQYIKSELNKLSPGAVTLAQILKDRGYKTAAFTGDAGISGSFGYSQGFDEYYDAEMFGGFNSSAPMAVEWLKKNKGSKFFLFVHGYDVHGQYSPPGGYDYRYVDEAYGGSYTGSKEEQAALREEGLKKGYLTLSHDDVMFWRAIYDEKISRADEKFGLFMEEIKNMGLMNNTIFVVLSDHGTEFYEHRTFDHGHTLYGELIDVLYSIHLPGQEKGMRISSLVSTIDTLPTLLGILGIENPASAQTRGKDITPSFSGKEISRNIFSETDYRLYTHKRSIITPDGWKMIMTYPSEEEELYNLNDDPLEKINLAVVETEKTHELGGIIKNHLKEMNSTGPWTIGCLPVYNDQCSTGYYVSSGKNSSKMPNILIINIDSLRADHMGIYGYEKNTTPFMDSLFRSGVVFDNAIATAPFTFQTDSSIFTGLFPSENGVYTWDTPMNKKTSLAQTLKQNGYSTAAFVAPSLYNDSGMFDYFDVYSLSIDITNENYEPSSQDSMKNVEISGNQLVNWISRTNGPFFAFFHVYDVHLPYHFPPDYFYSKSYQGIFSDESMIENRMINWWDQKNGTISYVDTEGSMIKYNISSQDIEYLKASYDYSINVADTGLKNFIGKINKTGDLDNTIIVISAEHGEDLMEHGTIFHSDIYNVNARVPLAIVYPGSAHSRKVEYVSSLDIAPTILGLLNFTIPEEFGGENILLPDYGKVFNRTIYIERPPFDEYAVLSNNWKYILRNPALREESYLNYISSIDLESAFFYSIAINSVGSGDELYDLSKDPYETENLAGKGLPVESTLREKAVSFRNSMRESKEKNKIGEDKEDSIMIFTYP